jgi:esterase
MKNATSKSVATSLPELSDEEYWNHLKRMSERTGIPLLTEELPVEFDILANGLRLHILTWGDASNPPVLILHGGGLNAHSWDLIAQYLSGYYYVVVPDQRGHGLSEWSAPMNYTSDDYASDSAAIIQQLSLVKPVVVGTSMGGVNALTLAAQHRAGLSGLILIDVPLHSKQSPERSELATLMQGERTFPSLLELAQWVARVRGTTGSSEISPSIIWNSMRTPDGEWTWRYDQRYRANKTIWKTVSSSRTSLRKLLPKIICPTLVMRGSESTIVLDSDMDDYRSGINDGTYVIVDGADHTVHSTKPRETLNHLEPFIARCMTSARL